MYFLWHQLLLGLGEERKLPLLALRQMTQGYQTLGAFPVGVVQPIVAAQPREGINKALYNCPYLKEVRRFFLAAVNQGSSQKSTKPSEKRYTAVSMRHITIRRSSSLDSSA